jgi:glycosyltransferase involved in cell wall biosynthesis
MRPPAPPTGGEKAPISCVIPAYNAERYLREAAESALRQSLPPCEIVIVDDGSTDGTADLAATLGNPIRLIRQARRGAAAARNAAVAASTGELVAFLDADDIWEPDKLKLQMELFGSCSGPAIVSAHTRNFWAEGLREQEDRLRDQWVSRPHASVNASSMLVSRPLFERIGGFDPALSHGELADWLGRARAAGAAFVVHPAVLVRRRIHDGNKSRAAAKRDQFFTALKALIDANRCGPEDPGPPPHSRSGP